MSKLNVDRKSRRGHPKLDKTDCRGQGTGLTISVRLNCEELALLEKKRGPLKKGEWLRMAAMDVLPPTVPEINRQAWVELARAHSNINQIAAKLNRGELMDIVFINAELAEFRKKLISCNVDDGSEN